MSTIEELLERKSSGSGLENREYSRRDPSRGEYFGKRGMKEGRLEKTT
jgi:hypothetical protein